MLMHDQRVSHLTYDRSDFSGGSGEDGFDHLKNQPLKFGNLRDITETFIEKVEDRFRDSAKTALEKAREGAREAATGRNIPNPLSKRRTRTELRRVHQVPFTLVLRGTRELKVLECYGILSHSESAKRRQRQWTEV
jgi:hypothetical protein